MKTILKIKRKILLILLILICSISNVYAANINISMNNEIELGKDLIVTITSDQKITDYELTINYPFEDAKVLDKLNGASQNYYDNEAIIKLFQFASQQDKTMYKAGSVLGKLSFKIANDMTLGNKTLTFNLVAIDTNGKEFKQSLTKTVKVINAKSADNSLKEIKINNNLIEGFNPTKTNYAIEVKREVSSVNLSAVVNDELATVSGTGNKTLKIGLNEFKLVVKAENGSQKTYQIQIKRQGDSDTSLKELNVDNKNILENNKLTYDIYVPNEQDSILIGATTSSSTSSLTGTGTKNVKVGKNIYKLNVKAEDGTTTTYTINVYREGLTNLDVDAIKINNELIADFNPHKYNYEIHFNSSINNISIEVNTNNTDLIIDYPKKVDLKYGRNDVEIQVKTKNSDEVLIYTLAIIRELNINLSELSINNEKIALVNNVYQYELTVSENVQELLVKPQLDDPNLSFIEGYGEQKILIKEKATNVLVKIKDQDNNEVTYTIKVLRNSSKKTSISILTIILAIITIISLSLNIIFITLFLKQKQNKI